MLRKAMEILSLFTRVRTDLGVVEIAELTGSPKSTVSRRLAAMEDAGFLERDPATGRYQLGYRLATLGHLARQATPLQRLARPVLRRLTEVTGETSDLVVLRGRIAVNVEAVESPRPLKHVGWVGREIPLHATASGKSLLAWKPLEEALAAVGPPPYARFTPHTLVAPGPLAAELERIRERGYSVSLGEFEPDLVGVAAPVRNHLADVVAVVTVGAPAPRAGKDALPALVEAVVSSAASLSRALGWSGPGAQEAAD